MNTKIFYISFCVAFILFWNSTSFAQPVINSVSGTFIHNATVTMDGSGFGTKSPAAPELWDNGTNTSLDTNYFEHKPDAQIESPEYNIQYRTIPYRSVAGPHSRVTKYIVGKHANGTYSTGADVFVALRPKNSTPPYTYIRWYYRTDPHWETTGSLPNHKLMDWNRTAPYSTPQQTYFEYNGMPGMTKQPNYHIMFWAPGCRGEPDYPCWGPTSVGNPVTDWVNIEVLSKHNASDGWLNAYANNVLELDPYYHGNDGITLLGSIAVGGFGRSDNYEHMFRFFSDIYIDTTPARVVLTNNRTYTSATIVEPQIPSAWGDGSITFAVNLGKLPASGTAYLFVFDARNKRNAVGYPVTIGEGSGPLPPTGLKIVQ